MTPPAQPRRVSQEELDAAIATWNRACAEGMIVEGDPGIPFDRRVIYTVAPQPEAVSAPGELWVEFDKDDGLFRRLYWGASEQLRTGVRYTRADLAQPDPSGVVGGFDVEKLIAAWKISNNDTPYFLRDWFARHAPNTNARQPEATPARLGDVEQMIRECIPGGSICDPQRVADNIRAWAAAEARKAPAGKLKPIPLSVRKPTREDASENGDVLWTWRGRAYRTFGVYSWDFEKWRETDLEIGWLPLNAAHIDTSALGAEG